MPLKPSAPSGRERGDEGFTLLEALVEVLLVSLAVGALAFTAAVTFDGWRRSAQAAEANASRELFAATLDQAAGRIFVPVLGRTDWVSPGEASEGKPLLLPWYRGNPESRLELGTDGARVWVRSWDVDLSLPLAATFRTLEDQGRVVGVSLVAGTWVREFRFGAVPAPGAAP